jgi:hypothetical protein
MNYPQLSVHIDEFSLRNGSLGEPDGRVGYQNPAAIQPANMRVYLAISA